MPESKIDPYHCGTVAPIWMRGQHPSVADGIVNRDACVNFKDRRNGCYVVIQIRVKNCNGFYVYDLKPAHWMSYDLLRWYVAKLFCFDPSTSLPCSRNKIQRNAHPNPLFNS